MGIGGLSRPLLTLFPVEGLDQLCRLFLQPQFQRQRASAQPLQRGQAEASLLPPNVCPLLQMTPGPGVWHIQQSLPASLAKAARPAPRWGGQTPGSLPSQLWDGALAGRPASEGCLWLVGSMSLVPSRWAQLCPPPRLPT